MTVTVETTREINLAQLAEELGTDALAMTDVDGQRTVCCVDDEIALEDLQAAVDTHAPAPPPPTAEEQLADLQAQVAQLVAQLTPEG